MTQDNQADGVKQTILQQDPFFGTWQIRGQGNIKYALVVSKTDFIHPKTHRRQKVYVGMLLFDNLNHFVTCLWDKDGKALYDSDYDLMSRVREKG